MRHSKYYRLYVYFKVPFVKPGGGYFRSYHLTFFFLLNMMRTTNTHSSDYYQSLDLSKIMPCFVVLLYTNGEHNKTLFYTELDLSDQEDNLISNFFSEVKGAKCDFYINIFLLITGTLCGPLGRMQVYINRHLLFKVIQLPCPCH